MSTTIRGRGPVPRQRRLWPSGFGLRGAFGDVFAVAAFAFFATAGAFFAAEVAFFGAVAAFFAGVVRFAAAFLFPASALAGFAFGLLADFAEGFFFMVRLGGALAVADAFRKTPPPAQSFSFSSSFFLSPASPGTSSFRQRTSKAGTGRSMPFSFNSPAG